MQALCSGTGEDTQCGRREKGKGIQRKMGKGQERKRGEERRMRLSKGGGLERGLNGEGKT